MNARQLNRALNDLEQWREQEIVTLVYAQITQKEASCGNALREEKSEEFFWVEVNEWGENSEIKKLYQTLSFRMGLKI